VGGATFYVIAHAIAKSALFMTAGAVTEATGETTLYKVGGMARRMPLLAVGSGFAAMAMMALPLSIGFFKDELFFAAATEAGRGMQLFAVLGAALSFAYIGRWWTGIFIGEDVASVQPVPRLLVWPVLTLGLTAIAGGVAVGPFLDVAVDAAGVSAGQPVELHLAYHVDARAENVMALSVFALGAVVMLTQRVWSRPLRKLVTSAGTIGPARIYVHLLRGSNRLSDSIHRFEVRDLRSRIATILAPAGLLVAMAVIVTPTQDAFTVGDVSRGDVPLIMMVAAAAVSGVIVTLPRDHLRLALTLSCVGFSLAVVYAFLGAPDVALVAVLIETLYSLVFFGMLVLMPRSILRYEINLRPERRRVSRDAALAAVAGVMAFLVAWGTLSRPSASTTVIEKQSEQSPLAHGYDVVTVILADFRGFDTMGEITVIAIAFLGVISLIRAGRLR
jgi:multicomponent Na+:H+ antiporter subunit A